MFEGISKRIREKKKKALRPDWDVAGQEGVAPDQALQADLMTKVDNITDSPDHEPASDREMGEDDSSQDKTKLRRAMKLVSQFFDMLS